MIIGFTGTQRGLSATQHAALVEFFSKTEVTEFHHGDCIGADAEAHDIATEYGIRIVIHPPLFAGKRACKSADVVLPPLSYLERNHAIVDAVELLVVAPESNKEELRSGTWATYRYAKKLNKPRLVLHRYPKA